MNFEGSAVFASVYDKLADDIDHVAWAAYIRGLLAEGGPVKKVADIGCGTGGITLELKKAGYTVLGVDISEAMLDIAADKARAAGLKILFVRQDMCGLALPAQDALVCACDVVNYIDREEVRAFLSAANRSLRPGGLLLFDISSRYKLRHVLGNRFFYEDRDNVTYFWKNTLARDHVDMELTFFLKQEDGYRRSDERHRQYIHTEKEMLAALAACGFAGVAYGFMTGRPPAEKDRRIQFYAVKQAGQRSTIP